MARHAFQGGGGSEGLGKLGLGAEAGPLELGQVMGELVHMRAEGEQVGVALGSVVEDGHGANSRGLGARVAGNG
ncbi:MAG TPA: hypothetical protein VM899_09595 [Rubellimicrobium sp.]|jgi:hypothetical protein|nr:hypothetical protein [Rubellimicrobium sp.]